MKRWRPTPFVMLSILLHAGVLLALPWCWSQWPWLLALIVGNHLLIMMVGLWPRSTWLGANIRRLPADAVARREVAITIDDGPDALVTPQVLQVRWPRSSALVRWPASSLTCAAPSWRPGTRWATTGSSIVWIRL